VFFFVRGLKENTTVNTNRGGTTTSLKKHIEDLDLTPFNTVILQFGGNDADRDIEIHDFNRNYLNPVFFWLFLSLS
jgi:hypothetical protein